MVATWRSPRTLVTVACRAYSCASPTKSRCSSRAAITTTLGGIRVDGRGAAAPGLWAAGADAGGLATGGYASGLAAALVLGRVAAAAALAGGAAAA